MRFLPVYDFEILTPYDPERIHSILERNMYQSSGKKGAFIAKMPTTKDGKLLDGTLEENGFVLKDYVNKKDPFYNKNSFEAVAKGTYHQGHGKTTIKIRMGLQKASKIIFSIWSILICFVVFTSIVSLILEFNKMTLGICLFTAFLMIIGYLMMLVSFRTSADKLEKRLYDILGRGKVYNQK